MTHGRPSASPTSPFLSQALRPGFVGRTLMRSPSSFTLASAPAASAVAAGDASGLFTVVFSPSPSMRVPPSPPAQPPLLPSPARPGPSPCLQRGPARQNLSFSPAHHQLLGRLSRLHLPLRKLPNQPSHRFQGPPDGSPPVLPPSLPPPPGPPRGRGLSQTNPGERGSSSPKPWGGSQPP